MRDSNLRAALLATVVVALAACGGSGSNKPTRPFGSEPLGSCSYSGSGNGQQVFVLDNVTKARCDELKGSWTP